MSTVSQPLSSVLASAQCGSSPVWNRQEPSSRVAAARSVGGSGRPPLAKSAIAMANAISVAMMMPTISLRCVASIGVTVEEIDLGIVGPHICAIYLGHGSHKRQLQTPDAVEEPSISRDQLRLVESDDSSDEA